MKKKILALLLSALMLMVLVAGCGEEPAAESADPGATTGGESTDGEIVELTWYMVGNGQPENYDAWKANLDAYLEEKIGVHLNVHVVGWGDWDGRRSTIVSTNEPYDIIFTNLGTFSNDVKIGAFADITEVVQSASPELYSLIDEDYWRAVSIDGKIYGVPTLKDVSVTQYFVWDAAMAEKYDPDYQSLNTLESLTDTLAAIKEGENVTPFILHREGLSAVTMDYDAMGTGLPPIGVNYNDETATVVSVFEQEDVMSMLTTLHEWYQAGIINADAATLAEAPMYRTCYVAQGWPYAAVTTWSPNMGVEATAVQWGNTYLSNDTVQGSVSCISASCAHPDKALQLLELVNTDSYVRDALFYGLEGENFEYVEAEDGSQRVHKLNNDWPMAGYTQGSFFNVTMLDDTDYNQYDEVAALNEAAIISPLLGFVFDTSSLSNELSSCMEIWQRYKSELLTGTMDPATGVPEMMEELRAAGFDELVAEAQTQIDAFMAGQAA